MSFKDSNESWKHLVEFGMKLMSYKYLKFMYIRITNSETMNLMIVSILFISQELITSIVVQTCKLYYVYIKIIIVIQLNNICSIDSSKFPKWTSNGLQVKFNDGSTDQITLESYNPIPSYQGFGGRKTTWIGNAIIWDR